MGGKSQRRQEATTAHNRQSNVYGENTVISQLICRKIRF